MAEKLEIVIEGKDRLSPAAKGATTSLKGLESSAHGARGALSGMTGMLQNALGVAGGFGIFNMMQNAISGLGSAMIGTNASIETATVQFEVLLGSAEAAQERVKELYDFAAKTPFQFPEVLKASKTLQNFGGNALATGKNLTLVGDMAAASGAGFEEVAMWVGRAYDAMQSGRPFGEAGMRLQELALLSGEARGKLEAMQKAGAKGSEMWAFFTKEMGKYNGMMEKQSQTFSGLMSTLADTVNQAMGKLGAPLFRLLKTGLTPLINFLGGPLSDAFTGIADIGERAFGELGKAIAPLSDTWRSVQNALKSGNFEVILKSIDGMTPMIVDKLKMWAQAFIDWVGPMLPPFFSALGELATNLVKWIEEQVPVLAGGLATWATQLIIWVVDALPGLWANLASLLSGLLAWIGDNAPGLLRKLIGEWVPAFIGWVAQVAVDIIPKLFGLLVTIGQWIVSDGAPQLLILAGKLADAIVQGLQDGMANLGPRLNESLSRAAGQINWGLLLANMPDWARTVFPFLFGPSAPVLNPRAPQPRPSGGIGSGGGGNQGGGIVQNFNGPINLPNVTDYASFERELVKRGMRAASLSRSPG